MMRSIAETPTRFAAVLLGAGWLLLVSGGMPVAAAKLTCAPAAVSATGEPASYQWLALIKAKGNWRSKVRSLPKLGGHYASWRRAQQQVETCISKPESVVCTVSARPCASTS